MRIMIKGGVWKNSEDEILKAAVMKYGKNQWARISSLLVRKSAKQCKARWYEWLDPSIQKTEWTREEEEKLLHLAKIMPTQWRTIAPIVGRTASQCLDHYEKLLDQAQKAEEENEAGPAGPSSTAPAGGADDPRRLRPGEFDPTPETKPARPDPVDMDEDEKEMLSEARARLANTRGKKAKRKAREKQLDEAKRLAHLQKRRELLAAGIKVRTFRKGRNDLDYTKEIPFEKRPAPGFYDTTQEDLRAQREKLDSGQVGKLLEKYEGKRRDDIEALERKRDEKRRKIFEEKDLPAVVASREKKEELPFRRSKLQLPAPQISDAELEAVTKSGNAARLASSSAVLGSSATRDLVADYTPTPGQTPVARTGANEESWEEVKKRELSNLRAYHASNSALEGGENTPVVESDFSGITPKRRVSSTPNTLIQSTPSTPGAGTPGPPSFQGSSFTPRSANKDGFKINTSDFESSEKAKFELLKRDLMRGLEALPEPKHEYKVVVEAEDLPPSDDDADPNAGIVEDALDTELKEKKRAAAAVAELKERFLSSSAKKTLPRVPLSRMNDWKLAAENDQTTHHPAESQIRAEVLSLAVRDEQVLDALGKSSDDASKVAFAKEYVRDEEGDNVDELQTARELVEQELGQMLQSEEILGDDRFIDRLRDSHALYTDGIGNQIIIDKDSTSEFLEMLQKKLTESRAKSKFVDQHLTKREKKAQLFLGGYRKRHETLSTKLTKLYDELVLAQTQLECFKALQEVEIVSAPVRLATAKAVLKSEQEKEVELQARYKTLAS